MHLSIETLTHSRPWVPGNSRAVYNRRAIDTNHVPVGPAITGPFPGLDPLVLTKSKELGGRVRTWAKAKGGGLQHWIAWLAAVGTISRSFTRKYCPVGRGLGQELAGEFNIFEN